MGIDLHGFNFLRFAHKRGPFGATLMIGRQGVHVDEATLRRGGVDTAGLDLLYAEELLKRAFGASRVDSLDYSDYEHATIVHDLNQPIPETLAGRYDTVLDFGTLEHVFQIPQALKTCSDLARPGGQILHVLPANNLCGHGFWQFSPELFLSLYKPDNGYAQTQIFLADLRDAGHVRRVLAPTPGERVNVRNASGVYVMVRAVRGPDVSHASVLQSDYVVAWDEGDSPDLRQKTRKTLGARIARALRLRGLDDSPFLKKLDVEAWIAGNAT